ncbi:MAG: DUF2971 domain-containing protein [Gammaproteobacteria bacterium]|nr:DUF2971 domain-containing protein [Gammaproteobacteria bacterium]
MNLFKFRDVKNPSRALDIILNNQLYCSDLESLNDPLEGIFTFYYTKGDGKHSELKSNKINHQIQKLRVCSLSKIFDSHLLWAHYADGFKGIAIEVEIPEQTLALKTVKYGGVFSVFDIDKYKDANSAAMEVLTSKFIDWQYEQEVRIIHEKDFFKFEKPVKRVIAGCKMPNEIFNAFNIICCYLNIPFRKLGIGDEGCNGLIISEGKIA